MQILSHRGYWKTAEEKNTRIAFERSFELGFGTETDLRDVCGKIVISHDMPKGDEITFEEVLQIMDGRNLPLALNIKADGQADEILRLLAKYNHTNYFTFDMSIPDLVVQVKKGVNAFSGMSDINRNAPLFEKVSGIWLDAFNEEWYNENDIFELLAQNKKVCIVSSDLHKRDTAKQWEMLKNSEIATDKNIGDNIMLCTDKPEEAKEYFYG